MSDEQEEEAETWEQVKEWAAEVNGEPIKPKQTEGAAPEDEPEIDAKAAAAEARMKDAEAREDNELRELAKYRRLTDSEIAARLWPRNVNGRK